MYLKLFRNMPQGSAISGRLVIDGRYFCNTLERVGYQIPAICYSVRVTMSPRFKRLLPIVQNVPQRSGIRFHRGTKPLHSTGCVLVPADKETELTNLLKNAQSNEEIILEVKYNRELPAYISQVLSFALRDGAVQSAISKYTWCRRFEDMEA